jgi:acetyl-CoA synthetase
MGDEFRTARDLLLAARDDHGAARAAFRWPRPATFNWALEWFDRVPARDALALWIVEHDGAETRLTFGELSERSDRVANGLRALGVGRGDPLLLMLGNCAPLWETMLAAMKLGAVVIPSSALLTRADILDRLTRAGVTAVVADGALAGRFDGLLEGRVAIAVGAPHPGFTPYEDVAAAPPGFTPDGPTPADDPILWYFTSGTTRLPKLVEHTHVSYPVGHLSTMYWIGLRPGDVHLNISSPGWGKHAWSSFFAPWNAEATVFIVEQQRFAPRQLLEAAARCGVTTLCAPPTVWRMLVQQDLAPFRGALREVVGAGEPLNPEVIARVEDAWGLVVRDGYGQTETTAQIGNSPGLAVRRGSMGLPLPGYDIVLVAADGSRVEGPGEGEVCIDLTDRPAGLMTAYRDSPEMTAESMRDGLYHTGDVALRDEDGYITFVGRSDDVFKASDYRISPFELESVLIEHPAVAEAAVVPSPDDLRLAVPKAFVALAAGHEASPDTARDILVYCRDRLAPYKRIRRIEFAELPKTISGKIRRVELREAEEARGPAAPRNAGEWWESDLVESPGSSPQPA